MRWFDELSWTVSCRTCEFVRRQSWSQIPLPARCRQHLGVHAKAPFRSCACIGTLNHGPSYARGKAPINRTHSKRFARGRVSGPRVSVWSACVFSRLQRRFTMAVLRFDDSVGSWRATCSFLNCSAPKNRFRPLLYFQQLGSTVHEELSRRTLVCGSESDQTVFW